MTRTAVGETRVRVHYGGPNLTVDSTIFEIELAL